MSLLTNNNISIIQHPKYHDISWVNDNDIDDDSQSDFRNYIESLRNIFDIHNVCSSHGIEHAIRVMTICEEAYVSCKIKYNLTLFHRKVIMLAGLLHDADDRKFFKTESFDNAYHVMKENNCSEKVIKTVILMISLVSASKNRDNIPDYAQGNKIWLLIPRWADRIEAIGIIGIKRSLEYTLGKKMPLYTNNTIIPEIKPNIKFSKNLLDNIATEERYSNYNGGNFNGNSESMIDHYYDKLIRAGYNLTKIQITCLKHKAEDRMKHIYSFIKFFSESIKNKKPFTETTILEWIQNKYDD